jgi:hypothetical protein
MFRNHKKAKAKLKGPWCKKKKKNNNNNNKKLFVFLFFIHGVY